MKKDEVICDLHTHTSFSDGELSPEELIREAEKVGIKVLGIADHDTMEALRHLPETEIEIVPGCELSLKEEKKDIHLLVYYPELNSELEKMLTKFRKIRYERVKKIVEKLNNLGVNITFEEVYDSADTSSFGRPHIAKVMIKKGIVNSIDEAFDKYLGVGKPAYVPKFKLTVQEGIRLAIESSGIPIIAHPGLDNLSEDFLLYLKELGMKGVEVFHPDHTREKEEELLEFALSNDLLVSGGSDFHGKNHEGKDKLAKRTLPYNFFEKIKEYKNEKMSYSK